MVSGRHCQKYFTNINIKPAWPQLLAFEKQYQESLRRLVSVIRLLKHFASHAPSQTCAAMCVGPDKSLRMFSVAGKRLRDGHESFRERFWAHGVTKAPKRPTSKKANSIRSTGISIIAQQRARNAALYSIRRPTNKVPDLSNVDTPPQGKALKRSMAHKQTIVKVPKLSLDNSQGKAGQRN